VTFLTIHLKLQLLLLASMVSFDTSIQEEYDFLVIINSVLTLLSLVENNMIKNTKPLTLHKHISKAYTHINPLNSNLPL